MSDTRQQAGSDGPSAGSGQAPAAPPTSMSEAEVMQGIEGLLDPPRRQRTQQTPPREPQEAPAAPETGDDPAVGPEDPAPDDTEEDVTDAEEGDEPEAAQQYELPPGWSKTDKEVFDRLPPEAQAIVTRREAEQNRAFVRKTEEINQHRQALEATFGEIQQERSSYAKNLEQLLFVAAPEAQKFAQIDWARLAREQPAEYVALTAERDALRGRIGGIQQELQRVQQQSQQAQAQQFAQLRQAEMAKLVEALPEFGDEQKGPKLASDMRQWLQRKGFRDDEIGQVIDSRVLLVVHEAMAADRARTARQVAETKRTTNAPAVQPPGAGRQRSDTRAAQVRAQKMAQLRKSGSEKDAISYLLDVL